eukprot:scaffold329717_cov61-Tisochrysis_lutea.AAC.2
MWSSRSGRDELKPLMNSPSETFSRKTECCMATFFRCRPNTSPCAERLQRGGVLRLCTRVPARIPGRGALGGARQSFRSLGKCGLLDFELSPVQQVGLVGRRFEERLEYRMPPLAIAPTHSVQVVSFAHLIEAVDSSMHSARFPLTVTLSPNSAFHRGYETSTKRGSVWIVVNMWTGAWSKYEMHSTRGSVTVIRLFITCSGLLCFSAASSSICFFDIFAFSGCLHSCGTPRLTRAVPADKILGTVMVTDFPCSVPPGTGVIHPQRCAARCAGIGCATSKTRGCKRVRCCPRGMRRPADIPHLGRGRRPENRRRLACTDGTAASECHDDPGSRLSSRRSQRPYSV